MNKDRVDEILNKITAIISWSELNDLFNEVLNNNLTQKIFDFDKFDEKLIWKDIDPKFRYLALEPKTGTDLFELYYFVSEPDYFCGIWDTDDEFICDRFRLYKTKLITEDTLFTRPAFRTNSLLS
jgi:hypothetical protein